MQNVIAQRVAWARRRHENILALIDLILSLPASTECEKGFSALKAVKTDWRNILKQDTLNHLLLVQLHSAKIEDFDPKPAVELWALPKKRRPTFMRQTKGSASGSKSTMLTKWSSGSESEQEEEQEELFGELDKGQDGSEHSDDEFFWA